VLLWWQNALTGPFPSFLLSGLPNLARLNLAGNRFTGQVTDMGTCRASYRVVVMMMGC
jgi:hypothetical protein